jgi:hypothetical protein
VTRSRGRSIALLVSAALCAIVIAGCSSDDDTPGPGEGTDVNTDVGDDTTTTGDPREASDGNSGANNGTAPGPDSDGGQDDGGQGEPPAPGG